MSAFSRQVAHPLHDHVHDRLQLPEVLRDFLLPRSGNESDRRFRHRDETEPPLRHVLRCLGQARGDRHPAVHGDRHPQLVHHQQDHQVVQVQVEGDGQSQVHRQRHQQLQVIN